MKITNSTFLIPLLFLIVAKFSYAATDSSTINFSFTHIEYVKLVGTVVGASRMFAAKDIKPRNGRRRGPKMNLGTLGLESNMPGNCSMDFSTLNNFKLRHVISNKRLSNYRLKYKGKKVTKRKHTLTLSSCNVTPSPLYFQTTGRFRKKVKSGIYRDVVTITVTTE